MGGEIRFLQSFGMEHLETPPSSSFFRYRDFTDNEIEALRVEFNEAEPFPHLAVRDFVKLSPESVLASFPPPDWAGWRRFQDAYQTSKMFCQDIERIPHIPATMIQELSSPAFLAFLQTVTGIPKLLPDPYLEGAGLHLSGSGGILKPHTDFHSYLKLNLYRRINVLVYLTPGWREEFGGCLELYKKGSETPVRSIVPEWGTCVVFRTDDRSVHGFSKPIAEGQWRRSIALYYYTSGQASEFSGDETTHWQAHGQQTGSRRARLWLYQWLLWGSRVCSRLAHQVNPNLGEALRPKVALVFGGAIGLLAGLTASVAGLAVAGAHELETQLSVLAGGTLAGAVLGAILGYRQAQGSTGPRRKE